MRVFLLFLRRLVISALRLLALFGPFWLCVGGLLWLVPENSVAEDARPLLYATAFLPAVLFGLLRLAVAVRQPVARWIGGTLFGWSETFSSGLTANLPDMVELTPTSNPAFRHPDAVDRAAGQLAAVGFVRVGDFLSNLHAGVPLTVLAHADVGAVANLFEAEGGRLACEITGQFPDGRRVSATNDIDRGLDPMPGRTITRLVGAAPAELFARFRQNAAGAELLPVTADTAAAAFAREMTEYVAWRRRDGFRPHEVGAMHAQLVTGGLSVLAIGTAVIAAVALLVGLLKANFAPDGWPVEWVIVAAVAVPVVFAPVALLLVFRARHRRAAARPPYEPTPPPAPAPCPGRPSPWRWPLALLNLLVVPAAILLTLLPTFAFTEGTVLHDERLANAGWLLIFGYFVLWPWVRDQFSAARREAAA